ncbi:unnamed protein product [Fraxinus pennsylvanica]|uniref:DEAD/DEAH-box helicase domain-containing protein n=1 Tax=Fraxinus pennsylvanica TaxID=56036 RepID=A0AAD1ZNM0_9LAMI|nr:unnamed protein product [Fraxinus pennsylvanica]
MSSLFLLRKSSSSKKLALVAFNSLFTGKLIPRNSLISPKIHNYVATSREKAPVPSSAPFCSATRCFHAGRTLRAEYAVADLSDADDRRGSSGVADDGLEIAKLGISQEIVSTLARKGITKLFPIQRAVLEPAMQGRDMIGRARTGTGKTLAFGIPIMDKIIQYNEKHGLVLLDYN